MSPIKNVVITGASGSLGKVVLEKLVASGKFNVRVLRRQGSSAAFPAGTEVIDVDFDSVDSLKAALIGQDAVVSTVGSAALASQTTIVDAAIAAGVQRFLPSEFGSDLADPATRALPVYVPKVQAQDYLVEKSKTTSLTYTFVHNGAFLDWGLEHGFILKTSDSKPVIVDSGDSVFSTTTLGSVAQAVIGVLTHPDETKNRSVYVKDIDVSQNQLLALAKQIAPERPWQTEHVQLAPMIAASNERLAKGEINMEVLVPYLWKAVMDPECHGNFDAVDNELLGIKGKTEKDIIDILTPLLK